MSKNRRTGRGSGRKKPVPQKSKGNRGAMQVIAVLLLTAVLFITLNERYFHIPGIPGWRELLVMAGLSSSDHVEAEGEVQVHFLDVGQGDCELIISNGCAMLIDSGEKEYANRVIDYIKAQGIEKLDYVIVTHPHSDHAGGMGAILSEFETGTLIMPELPGELIPGTSTYIRLLKAIDNKNIKVEYAKAGVSFNIGECTTNILAPAGEYEDLNNYSVVVKLTHGENAFLFTGDIEEQGEKDILSSGAVLEADVLKVAHHGSSTSSIKKFLKAVNGSYAVIEVGAPNSYNHPNKETVKRLESLGYEILRTDLDGSIVFLSDGKELKIITENETQENQQGQEQQEQEAA